ncbi:MAG: transglycosylase domain-containing protein [Acetivibrio ethanolgignens]
MNYSQKGTANKQRALTSRRRRMISKVNVAFFRTLFLCFLVCVIVGGFAGFGVIKGLIDNAPSIDSIDVAPSGFATTLYYSNGKESQKLIGSGANRVYVTLDQIPDYVENAFIAIEDARFRIHNGIDVKGIFRAFFNGLSKGEFDEGASTLTQQLLKNQIFNGGSEPTFIAKLERKIQEQYLAIQLEDKLSKDQILEYYLNTINLGQNTLGVQTASLRYFGKDVSELTISEAAVIAGITQSPAALNPISHPEANRDKREIVLRYMKEQGFITESEYEEALADDVYSRIQQFNEEQYSDTSVQVNSYFTDAVCEQVIKDLQDKLGYSETQAVNALYRDGLQIFTTQSQKIQKICDKIFRDESMYPASSQWALTYRLSIMGKDGEEHHYNEYHLKKYFVTTKKQTSFDLYFKNKEDAVPYIEEFRAHILEDAEEITGESTNYTIQPQISFVLMNQYNGKVLALVGGRGEKTASRTLNRATDSTRQPGSTFKVVSTYLPALDTRGMTLASVQDDAEFYYPDSQRKVHNWDGDSYKGLTTLRQGIVRSMNVVTVKTMVDVTPSVAYDYLMRLGFTTVYDKYVDENGKLFSDLQYPTALGGLTKGVTNFELTAAFAAIANKGVYTKPTLYTKILDHDGNVLLENKPETRQVMKESTAWLLTNAMEDVVKVGTGGLTRFTSMSMPVAGKTGTTSNDIDLWFVGYTPYYTAGIWSGYDNNKDQDNTSYHKVLWRTVMQTVHQKLDKEYKEFEKPGNIVTAKICTKSGKLAVDGLCDGCIRTEYFEAGTVPTEKCDIHVKFRICNKSKKIAGKYCPEDEVTEQVFLLKEETGKTADTPYVISPDELNETCHIHTSPVIERPVEEPTDEPVEPAAPSEVPSEAPTDSPENNRRKKK